MMKHNHHTLPPGSGPDPETEAQRRTLRRYRLAAGLLLLAMAALYFASFWFPGQETLLVGLVQAGAEAALVGGLADWFAVTAIFRRPLGLPIPHTALIPSNKDRIGRRLGRFVTNYFAAPELLEERMRGLKAASRIGAWLADRRNAERAARRVADLLPVLLDAAGDDRLRAMVRKSLTARLRRADVAPLLGRMLAAIPDREYDLILSQAVVAARDYLARHEDTIQVMVAERTRWWIPRAIDKRVAKALVEAATELLDDLGDPASERRLRVGSALRDFRARLQSDPEMHERIRVMKNRALRHPQVQERLSRLWDDARGAILENAGRDDGRLRQGLADALQRVGNQLQNDVALQRAVDDRIESALKSVLMPWRQEIGTFIEDVVRRWDARTLTERLELTVGRDLQYIRINGTLVGAFVGCVLHLIVVAMH